MENRHQQLVLDLSRSGIEAGEKLRLKVVGESMLPLLREGDTVWVEQAQLETLIPGDLLVVELNRELVVHRLIAIHTEGLLTKGDHVTNADPWQGLDRIFGRVVGIETPKKKHGLERGVWRRLGRFLAALSYYEAKAFARWGAKEPPKSSQRPARSGRLARQVILIFTRTPLELVKYAWR